MPLVENKFVLLLTCHGHLECDVADFNLPFICSADLYLLSWLYSFFCDFFLQFLWFDLLFIVFYLFNFDAALKCSDTE